MFAGLLLFAAARAVLAGGGGTRLPPPPPPGLVITEFEGELVVGTTWMFYGTVQDNNGSSQILVTLGGLPPLRGKTCRVQADGSFMIMVDIGNSTGIATAVAFDDQGQVSEQEDYFVY
jgi:hypothetical protein